MAMGFRASGGRRLGAPCPRRLVLAALLGVASAAGAAGTARDGGVDDLSHLKRLTIQDLLEVPVTSVSRRPQKYADAAAALYVISREDIRRSGATSIPELLRMVPGVQVARIDASKWAVTARGFNGRYANKLLVQLDGRTLYTPLFSGVYWDVQDTVLEDIDRIEVIRGPGATMWGANAVNGVINIITRSSHDTEGGLLTAGIGNEEEALGTLRWGTAVGDSASLRIYAKGIEHDGGLSFSGEEAADDWRSRRFGFRTDIDLTQADTLTVQGDYYEGNAGAVLAHRSTLSSAESDTSGGNLLARWSRRISARSGLELQLYYDHTERANWTLDEDRDTFDLDLQHYFSTGRHVLVWGLGYRLTRDQVAHVPGGALRLEPQRRDAATVSAFMQDDIAFPDRDLHLILGTKYEHNDYTGDEWQPTVRLLWSPAERASLWAAVSRAVRTPSRAESDLRIDAGGTRVRGNPDLVAERLIAYEAGLRAQPVAALSLDLSGFYNDYEDLQSIEASAPDQPAPIDLRVDNRMTGESYGLELAANWDVLPHWRLKAAYTWLEVDLKPHDGSTDASSARQWDSAPRHQLNLRSWLDIRPDLELDLSLYLVDRLANGDAQAYQRLDVRLGWRPLPGLELGLIGRNLLDASHPEFPQISGNSPEEGLVSTQAERSVLAQLTWRF